jgi:hypothetical protein
VGDGQAERFELRMAQEIAALKAEVERLEQRSGCEHCSDRRRVADAERDILAAKLAEVEKERYETEAWFINARRWTTTTCGGRR